MHVAQEMVVFSLCNVILKHHILVQGKTFIIAVFHEQKYKHYYLHYRLNMYLLINICAIRSNLLWLNIPVFVWNFTKMPLSLNSSVLSLISFLLSHWLTHKLSILLLLTVISYLETRCISKFLRLLSIKVITYTLKTKDCLEVFS